MHYLTAAKNNNEGVAQQPHFTSFNSANVSTSSHDHAFIPQEGIFLSLAAKDVQRNNNTEIGLETLCATVIWNGKTSQITIQIWPVMSFDWFVVVCTWLHVHIHTLVCLSFEVRVNYPAIILLFSNARCSSPNFCLISLNLAITWRICFEFYLVKLCENSNWKNVLKD